MTERELNMGWYVPPGGGVVFGFMLGVVFWAIVAGILCAVGVL
jgi:hypothetical protein